LNWPVYVVLPTKTLHELVLKMPSNIKQLAKIKGFGKVKIQQFGEDVLEIIDSYCERAGIDRDTTEIVELKPKKEPKKDTKFISYELYRQGKTIKEIAEDRGFVESTIFGHLTHFVSTGEIEVSEIMDKQRFDEMLEFVRSQNTESLTDLVEASQHKYTYNEFRLVLAVVKKDEVSG